MMNLGGYVETKKKISNSDLMIGTTRIATRKRVRAMMMMMLMMVKMLMMMVVIMRIT